MDYKEASSGSIYDNNNTKIPEGFNTNNSFNDHFNPNEPQNMNNANPNSGNPFEQNFNGTNYNDNTPYNFNNKGY